MALEARPIRFYTAPASVPELDWTTVAAQLRAAPTYWVVSVPEDAAPHPRPVWGVWDVAGEEELWLTLGSPRIRKELAERSEVAVHLDSGVDVVIVEGVATRASSEDPSIAAFLTMYDAKYDWTYEVHEYGPPVRVAPTQILAWHSGGWAGRDGFQTAGRWVES